jgi:hypothetical protein
MRRIGRVVFADFPIRNLPLNTFVKYTYRYKDIAQEERSKADRPSKGSRNLVPGQNQPLEAGTGA